MNVAYVGKNNIDKVADFTEYIRMYQLKEIIINKEIENKVSLEKVIESMSSGDTIVVYSLKELGKDINEISNSLINL